MYFSQESIFVDNSKQFLLQEKVTLYAFLEESSASAKTAKPEVQEVVCASREATQYAILVSTPQFKQKPHSINFRKLQMDFVYRFFN
jgi:hypothetical protein